MATGEAQVIFDVATGAIKGAGPVQYAGLRAMALAAKAFRPVEDVGFSYAARLVRSLFPASKEVIVRFDGERAFQFPYGDAYWSLLLNRNHVYEEEVDAFLLAIKDIDYAFIDCGANYGYWSIQVTSDSYGGHVSVAIEADEETYSVLQSNQVLNSGRFEIMHRAVARHDDERVAIYGKKHEARSIVADGDSAARAPVVTISLDTLAENPSLKDARTLVLKLDIEGVEVSALEGAKKLLERDIIVVYEDHGSDPRHQVTDYLMNAAGMRAYGFERGRFFNLTSPRDLDAMKTNSRRGYDFFATKSDFWQRKMSELVG